MNNKQFIGIIFWLSIISGVIGYNVGGVLLFVVGVFGTVAFFLYLGD